MTFVRVDRLRREEPALDLKNEGIGVDLFTHDGAESTLIGDFRSAEEGGVKIDPCISIGIRNDFRGLVRQRAVGGIDELPVGGPGGDPASWNVLIRLYG